MDQFFCVTNLTFFFFFALFYETEESWKGDELVEIHMYFGGKFRSNPNIAYIGNYKIDISKDMDPNDMSIIQLCRIFKQVDLDTTKITFW